MREYSFPATEATIEAFRQLRRPWAGYRLMGDVLVIALAEGGAVSIRVESADIEPDFEAFHLSAALSEAPTSALEPPDAFAAGGNDVVLFRSETWIEQPAEPPAGALGRNAVLQFTGSPLQRSSTADAVCAVDDAVVVATSAGTGLLVRCGLQPYSLEVTPDPLTIARFLAERHYGGDAPTGR